MASQCRNGFVRPIANITGLKAFPQKLSSCKHVGILEYLESLECSSFSSFDDFCNSIGEASVNLQKTFPGMAVVMNDGMLRLFEKGPAVQIIGPEAINCAK